MAANGHREDYVFAGYLVTQPVVRPPQMSRELLPDRLLTASSCIARFVPDTWSLEWTSTTGDERRKAARELGLDRAAVTALTRHVTDAFDENHFGWPNVVMSTEALVGLLRRLPTTREWVALGLALRRDHVPGFLDENRPPEGTGAAGVYRLLAQRLALPEGGTNLGFEPLGFEVGGRPHSWLCNHLEVECFRALGIRPAASGLLETEDDAERVTAHISRDEVGAEPVHWLPWMILDYTAESRP
jgi:hypothetical protein